MNLPRTIEKEIPSLGQRFKVLLTTGMRQVGKSTLLSHLSQGTRTYVTLDDAEERELVENAPSAFSAAIRCRFLLTRFNALRSCFCS